MAAYLFEGCVVPRGVPTHQWHTGEPLPKHINEARVVTIQADCDELDIIMEALNRVSSRGTQ